MSRLLYLHDVEDTNGFERTMAYGITIEFCHTATTDIGIECKSKGQMGEDILFVKTQIDFGVFDSIRF